MEQESMRLDRYLSLQGEWSRREATELIRSGQVKVNGLPVKDGKIKLKPDDEVSLRGEVICHKRYRYYMMNKPAGVLTAARDVHASTVMDLLPPAFAHRDVRPVGRLDKDSTGLLLLTNDGEMAHRLLAPKSHVWKRYEVTVSGKLPESAVEQFQAGMDLGDFVTQSAHLLIHTAGDESSAASVSIREGKFHQVKRMFSHIGHEVLSLHRAAFGPLTLPDDLAYGAYRELTEEELLSLRETVSIPNNNKEETL